MDNENVQFVLAFIEYGNSEGLFAIQNNDFKDLIHGEHCLDKKMIKYIEAEEVRGTLKRSIFGGPTIHFGECRKSWFNMASKKVYALTNANGFLQSNSIHRVEFFPAAELYDDVKSAEDAVQHYLETADNG